MPLPKKLDTSQAVLFLGSGFTSGALSISGKSPPVGSGLTDRLAEILQEPKDKYSFQTLSNAFLRRKDLSLFDEFTNMFRISSVNQVQKELISRRWLRIYTTNYDDAVEVAMRQNGIDPLSFNYDDDKPAKTPRNSIVHLHGFIANANDDNLLEQLVLTQKSYIKQHFASSSWYDEFRRDIRFCSALFFIRYRLQDPHITALIPTEDQIRDKTFFITRGIPDKLFAEDLQDYGEIHPIETSGFVRVCRHFINPDPIDTNKLKSIKIIDVFKDNKAIMPPTSNEILDLVAFGKFNERRCLSNLPEPNYILPRLDLASRVELSIQKNATILVHSRLGNGKSILLYSIAHYLTQKGYTCFRCIENAPSIEAEISAVSSIEKLVFIFDSYDVAIGCVDRFLQLVPHAKYIVNVRTGIQQVRIHEIVEKLPQPLGRVDANNFTALDKSQFIELLERTGVVKDDLSNRIYNSSDIRDTVTAIYDNTYVKARISASLQPILQKKKLLGTLGVTLILTWIGQPVEMSMFVDILDVDPVQIFSSYREAISDIVDSEGDVFRAKSPIFAEYLIQTQFDVDDVILLTRRILLVAVTKKSERRYRTILSALMSFAQLNRLLHSFPEHKKKIISLYNELQRDIDVREEPLFWLQYAIAMVDDSKLDLAEGFMITAYEKADKNVGFQTYQLDTQALRINLMIEMSIKKGQPVARHDKILKNLSDINGMISDANHRQFAVRVLENVRPYVEKRSSDMSPGELSELGNAIGSLCDSLAALAPGVKAELGAELRRVDLELCRLLIAGAI